jgi:hypothetical protein
MSVNRACSSETMYDQHYRNRRLFRTAKSYLGLGPLSVQPGDQVWLFLGARIPFVLRKVSDEGSWKSDHRKFVGEAYVHGIMDGEALREKKIDFQPVTLVS